MSPHRKKSRIVIIGSNFAGLTAVSKLDKCHDITVIDSRQDFQWTPNIHEILSDVKKETNLSLHLPTVISKLGHRFVQQKAMCIDGITQTVTLDNSQELPYDVLLVASGHTRSNYNVKGAQEFAYGFRSAEEVIKIHEHLSTLLNGKASLDSNPQSNNNTQNITVNIIGGGFTGVEVLGELLRKHATNKQLQINVIENASRLVSALPTKLSDDILRQCKDYQVKFHFDKTLSEVKNASIHFKDGTAIESDLTIWSAGTKLPDYLASIATKDKTSQIITNRLVVNDYLQSEAFDNIFVAGDSASLASSPAKQASIAMDMGQHAASNINKLCANKTLSAFKIRTRPVLLSLGDLNTYFIQGNLVLASPLLASAKEGVYQLYMAHLSSMLPIEQRVLGVANRAALSTEKLLLAEILKLRPRVLLGRTKFL